MNSPAAGWNPDPTGRHEYRYWDGTTWTNDVSDEGVTSVDPVGPAPTGGEPTAAMDPTQQYSPQPGEPGGYGPQQGPYGQQPPGGYGAQAGGYGSPPGGYDPSYGGQVPPGPPRKSGPSTGLIVGLAILALALIAGLVFFLTRDGDDDTATSDETTTTEDAADTTENTAATTEDTGPTDADVFSLEVGDCLADDTEAEEVQEVPVVPCDQPHVSEIFHSYMIETESLPGADEMEAIVTDQCLPVFETFVGVPYEDSVLEVTWLEPTPGSWDAGDRELLCMLVDPAGEMTGSAQGTAR